MSGTPTNPYIYYILGSDGSNFKIVSKSGGTLTDRLEISSVGNMTFNGNLNATSYIVGGTNILTITSNYTASTSNILVTKVNLNDTNTSNYVVSTSNILVPRIQSEITSASNLLVSRILFEDKSTSNILIPRIQFEVTNASNILVDAIKNNKSSQWTTSNLNIYYNEGNVGIGTTNPLNKLEVWGVLKITANSAPTNDQLGVYIWNQVNVGPTIAGNSFEVRTGGDTPRMRINTSGNVGIGTTDPRYKCHIRTAYDVIASGLHLDASDGSLVDQYTLTMYPYVIGAAMVGWKFRTISQTGGTNTPMTFDNAGNVAISGTPNSSYKLNVGGTVNATSYYGSGANLSGLTASQIPALDAGKITTGTFVTSLIPNLATSNIINLDTVLSGKQGTINSVANQIIIGNGDGSTKTSPGLTFNTSTNTFATSNIAVYGDLTVTKNLTVYGNETRLETIVYTTEKLEVVNENIDSVALMVQQSNSGTNDIFVASNQSTRVFNIANNGDVNITGIYKKNNRDVIQDTSNYVASASNILVSRVNLNDTNSSNYVVSTSNILVNRINSSTFWTSGTSSIYYNGGNVGIGTNNPRAKLDIATPDNTATATNLLDFRNIFDYGIYATSISIASRGNTLDFLARDYNLNNGIQTRNVLSLRPEGNVGIGTNNPGNILQVGSGARLRIANNTDDFTMIGTNDTDGTTNARITLFGNTWPYGSANGNIQYTTTSTGKHIFFTGGTDERMRIANNGAVSIGGTLSVGATTITGNSVVVGTLEVGAATAELLISGNSIVAQGTDANIPLTLQTKGTSSFAINTGATPAARLSITDAGNVGIGTNTRITNKLLVHQGSSGTTGATCYPLRISAGAYTSAGNGTATLIGLATQNDEYFEGIKCGIGHVRTGGYDVGSIVFLCNNTQDGTNATMSDEKMRITSTGNVGIGTNNPLSRLHLHNNATTADCRIIISDNTSTASASRGFHLIKASDNLSYLWNYENTATVFATNNVERMRIASTGNVGIGTNNPGNILQVGDGGRLRIANDDSDYTMIGTRNINGATNTQITMYGNTHPNASSPHPDYAGRMELMSTASGSIVFFTTNAQTERLRITSTGNVGIGTATVNYKLHVEGTSLLNGQVYIGTSSASSTIFMGGGAAGDTGYDHSVIETRNYAGTEKTEMLLFKGNDFNEGPGPDRIRLRAGQIVFDTYSTGTVDRTAESIRMTIMDSGNVGIGITNPSYKMHLCNTGIVATETTGVTCMPLRISAGAYSDTGNGTATLIGLATQETAGTVWTKCAIGHCRTAQFDVGSIVFLCNNSATSSSVSMSDERMRITSTGNVGIGTNNPVNIFQIGNGDRFKISNSSSDVTVIGSSETPANTRINLFGSTHAGAPGQISYVAPSTGDHIFFTTNSTTERMRIKSDGNVAIGTTDPAGYKLNVNGSINATSLFVGGTAFTGSSQWVGTTNIYNITGNVGIGTSTTPINLLELTKSTYTGALLSLDVGDVNAGAGVMPQAIGKPLLRLGRSAYSATTGDYYGIGFGWAPLALSNSCCEIGAIITSTAGNETGDLVLSTRAVTTDIPATERMRITSAGNVGIGTAPTQKLDIAGSILIRAYDATSGGTKGIFFRDGYMASPTQYNCSILTYDHNADTFCDGISINGGDGVSFCTGANTRQERMRIDGPNGNVGIGTINPTNKLHIVHSSTALHPEGTGGVGLYVYNSTNVATNNSIICNRIAGTTANKVIYSLDVFQGYGWAMYLQGNDTTNKLLRFNSAIDASGTDRLVINGATGAVGIGTNNPGNILQVGGGGRLRIANDNTDYTLIGTTDVAVQGSPRIVISGITRSVNPGCCEYLATTSTGSHIFCTTDANTEILRIASNGYVGIGRNNPTTAKLEVSGNMLLTGGLWCGTDGIASLALATSAGSYSSSAVTGDFVLRSASTNKLFLQSGGGAAAIAITSAGNVGIGNTAPIGPLCIGNASVASSDGFLVIEKNGPNPSSRQFKIGISDTYEFVIGDFGVNNVAGTWIQQFKIANNAPASSAIIDATGGLSVFGNITAYYSDERLKTKTANISNPLKIIDKLNGFYYTPNELAHSLGITNNKQDIGLSAQEVQSVLPELVNIAPFDLEKDKDGNKVSKSGENYLTLSYDRLAPVFVEAIKELNQKNISLTIENNELKEKYNKLLEDITLIKQTLKLV